MLPAERKQDKKETMGALDQWLLGYTKEPQGVEGDRWLASERWPEATSRSRSATATEPLGYGAIAIGAVAAGAAGRSGRSRRPTAWAWPWPWPWP